MILRIANNIHVGSTEGIVFTTSKEWAVIHASQIYHYSLLGWVYGKPDKESPNYLFLRKDFEVSVNWVDGRRELYEPGGVEMWTKLMDFIDEAQASNRKIFIHCDKGESRSPTLGMVYLAKRLQIIPNHSFEAAVKAFKKIYPKYQTRGISEYVASNWNEII